MKWWFPFTWRFSVKSYDSDLRQTSVGFELASAIVLLLVTKWLSELAAPVLSTFVTKIEANSKIPNALEFDWFEQIFSLHMQSHFSLSKMSFNSLNFNYPNISTIKIDFVFWRYHCVKSVRTRSYFSWSVFFHIPIEYGPE